MTEKQTEALEKLNRGVQESRQEVQQRTMSLAQDYFGDSAEALKQQIKENRAALEGLPDQVPGGREEAFQTLFQELMDNYSAMEQCINEAREDVANLDTDQIRRQGEVEATDAARRQAREMGIDLTEVEGTGTDGRVTVDDVKKIAQTMEDGAAQQAQGTAGQAAGQAQEAAGQATGQAGQVAGQADGGAEEIDAQIVASDAARREAKERGIDLSKVKGTGAEGRIVYWDVVDPASEAEVGADPAGQAAQQAQDAASQAAGQGQEAAGQATDQAGQVAQGAQAAFGQVAGQVGQITDQAGGAAEEMDAPIDASDAAKREAKERGIDLSKVEGTGADGRIVYWDVVDPASEAEVGADPAEQAAQQAQDAASQAAGQGQEAAGQATDQAGQVAGQAQEAAGGAAQQAQDTVGGLTGGGQGGGGPLGGVADQVGQVAQSAQDTAGQAAGQATDQAGQVAGQAQEAAGGAAQQAASGNQAEEPRVTNAARRKAEEMDVDLSKIKGTGSGGLITIKDVTGS